MFIPSNGLIVGIKNQTAFGCKIGLVSWFSWHSPAGSSLVWLVAWKMLSIRCRKLGRKLRSKHLLDPVSNWIKLDRFSEFVSPRLFEVHDHDLRSRDPGICDGPPDGPVRISQKLPNQKSYAMIPDFNDLRDGRWTRHTTTRLWHVKHAEPLSQGRSSTEKRPWFHQVQPKPATWTTHKSDLDMTKSPSLDEWCYNSYGHPMGLPVPTSSMANRWIEMITIPQWLGQKATHLTIVVQLCPAMSSWYYWYCNQNGTGSTNDCSSLSLWASSSSFFSAASSVQPNINDFRASWPICMILRSRFNS